MVHYLFSKRGIVSVFAAMLSLGVVSAVYAETPTIASSPVGSKFVLPIILGMYLLFLAFSGLIVLFVDPRDFSRKEFLGIAWPLTKKYFWLFVGLLIVQQIFVNLPAVITAAVQLSLKLGNDEPISNALNMIVALLVSAILQGGMAAIALAAVDGKEVHFGMLFSQAKKVLRLFGGMLLYGLIVFGGFILLVVPGIIWSIKFSFWLYAMVDQDKGVMDSLRESARITEGHKGSLAWMYCYLGALNILGILLLLVGLFATVPITQFTMAYAYRKLVSMPRGV